MLCYALSTLHRVLLLAALTVALTATGFAHRVPSPQDGALAFALANGADTSDFCGGSPGTDPDMSGHCPACQITASGELGRGADRVVALQPAVRGKVVAPRQTIALRRILDPSHGPQGPPAV